MFKNRRKWVFKMHYLKISKIIEYDVCACLFVYFFNNLLWHFQSPNASFICTRQEKKCCCLISEFMGFGHFLHIHIHYFLSAIISQFPLQNFQTEFKIVHLLNTHVIWTLKRLFLSNQLHYEIYITCVVCFTSHKVYLGFIKIFQTQCGH